MVLNVTAEGLKGPWQPDEDKDLIRSVELWGSEAHCWRSVSEEFNKTRNVTHHRSMKQCRERYLLHLRPDISNDPWTHQEDELIVQGHKHHGNKWQEIAKMLPGRTESSVKNHWNATLRRKFKFNDPAEAAPLRKYIRSLLEAEELAMPSSAGASPMASMGQMSQPGSAKKHRGGGSMASGQGARLATWNAFEQGNIAGGSPPADDDWSAPQQEEGNTGPNLLMAAGGSGSRLQRHGSQPHSEGAAVPTSSGRKGGGGSSGAMMQPMGMGMGMGMGMAFPGAMANAMLPPAMMRGAGGKNAAMMPFISMAGMPMFANMEMGEAMAGTMLPATSLRIKTKRPSVRQPGLGTGQGSASGSGGPVSELTRVDMLGSKRPVAAAPTADTIGSDQDSLVATFDSGQAPPGGAGSAGANATPRGQKQASQRTPHSHASHPMAPQMMFGAPMAFAAGVAAEEGDEEEEEEEVAEEGGEAVEGHGEEGAAVKGASGGRKRAPGGSGKGGMAGMADMVLGGRLSVSPGQGVNPMWANAAAMMMMPQQMMMAAGHAMGGEDDEDWGSGDTGAEGTGAGGEEGSPAPGGGGASTVARAMRKKARMAGMMPWGPAMMGMMPMAMSMGGHAAHPAMQMMMQQQAMLQHMGMAPGSPHHMGMQMMPGSGGNSPMASAGMMPWGPMGPWGMPMMMGPAGNRNRKRKGTKLGADGGGTDSPMAGGEEAGAGRAGYEDDGGDEEGSQAGGQGADDGAGGAGGWEAASRGRRAGRQGAGDTTRVMPGQARVQQGGGGGRDENGDAVNVKSEPAHEEGPDADIGAEGDEDAALQGDDDGDEGSGGVVRRSKRSTRGVPRGAAAAVVAGTASGGTIAATGSPSRRGARTATALDPDQRSSHSQAASQMALKKRGSVQHPTASGQHSDGVAGPAGGGVSSVRSRMAQQHNSALAKPTGSRGQVGGGSGPTWSGRGGDVDSGSKRRRREAGPDPADGNLFDSLLAAAAAIESEGDSLEQKQDPQGEDGGLKGATSGEGPVLAKAGSDNMDSGRKRPAASGTDPKGTSDLHAAHPESPVGRIKASAPTSSGGSRLQVHAHAQPAHSHPAPPQWSSQQDAAPPQVQQQVVNPAPEQYDGTSAPKHAWAGERDAAHASQHAQPFHPPARARGGRQEEEWAEALPGQGAVATAPAGAPVLHPRGPHMELMEMQPRMEPMPAAWGEMASMPAMESHARAEVMPRVELPTRMSNAVVPTVGGGKREKNGHGHQVPTAPKSKTAWSKMESDLLCKFVDEYGGTANTTPWTFVAHKLNSAMREAHARLGPGVPYCERTSKQCRERWIHNLAPHVCKDAWTEDENNTLAEAHKQYGNQWSRVARLLPGRTENTVKNHWNATLRRKQPARLPGGGISSLDVYMVLSGLKTYDPDTTSEIYAQVEDSKLAAQQEAAVGGVDGQWQAPVEGVQPQWQQALPMPRRSSGTQEEDQAGTGGAVVPRAARGRAAPQQQQQQQQHSVPAGAGRGGSGGGAAPQSGDGLTAAARFLMQQQQSVPPVMGMAGMAQRVMQVVPDGSMVMAGGNLSSPHNLTSPHDSQSIGNDSAARQQQVQHGQQHLVNVTWEQLSPTQLVGWDQASAAGQQQQQQQQAQQQGGGWDQGISYEQMLVNSGGNMQLAQVTTGASVQLHPVQLMGQHVSGGGGGGSGQPQAISHGQLAAMTSQGQVEWGAPDGSGRPRTMSSSGGARPLSAGRVQVPGLPSLPVPPPPHVLQQLNAAGMTLQQYNAGGAGTPQTAQQYSNSGAMPQQHVQQYNTSGGGSMQQQQQHSPYGSGGGAQPQQAHQMSGGGAQQVQVQRYSNGGNAMAQYTSAGGAAPQGYNSSGQLQPVQQYMTGQLQPMQQYSGGGGALQPMQLQQLQQLSGGGAVQLQPLQQFSAVGGTLYYSPVPGYAMEVSMAPMASRVSNPGGVGPGSGQVVGHPVGMDGNRTVGDNGGGDDGMRNHQSMGGGMHVPMTVSHH